jgi:hypothetical protein
MTEGNVIDIGTDFSRFPAGRYRSDGKFSGERFRDDILVPALRSHQEVVLKLDGTMGFGSSFLEEVFGGLIRSGQFTAEQISSILRLESSDKSLIDEIYEYISSTRH